VSSLDANVFSSRRKNMLELTKRAPLTLSAAAFAASSSATFSSTGTSNGSTLIGLRQVPPGVRSFGASTTGRTSDGRLARACATASRATRTTSSGVTSRLAAKPHAPSTSTRTPNPDVSLSTIPCTRCSRVKTFCVRLRLTRQSAYDAPGLSCRVDRAARELAVVRLARERVRAGPADGGERVRGAAHGRRRGGHGRALEEVSSVQGHQRGAGSWELGAGAARVAAGATVVTPAPGVPLRRA
jgi:hypothetical protein